VLKVDGQTYRQPLRVKLDPRVNVSLADLEAQMDLARSMDAWMNSSFRAYQQIAALRAAIAESRKTFGQSESNGASNDLLSFDAELSQLQEGTATVAGFGTVNRDLARFVTMIQSGDTRPAQSAIHNTAVACKALQNNLDRWRQINRDKLSALNARLPQQKSSPLPIVSVEQMATCPN
jgi:hypothetical protein